jgi:hypothetical protein
VRIVNLTPHELSIFNNPEGTGTPVRIPPSGTVARVRVADSPVDLPVDVPCFRTRLEGLEDLPPPEDGTLYVTSLVVRGAVPERKDVASPGKLIRNDSGQPVGCHGLALN